MKAITEAIEKGRSLSLYEDSEQSDQGQEENVLDYLWQSLFDVYKLVMYDVLEDVSEEEKKEVVDWLILYQKDTEKYKNVGIPF